MSTAPAPSLPPSLCRRLDAVTAHLAGTGAAGGGDGRTLVAIQGPGGTGKTALIAAVRRRCADSGLAVLGLHGQRLHGQRLHDQDAAPVGPAPAGVVVVDDAHRLPAEDLARLRDLVRTPQARVLVAYRPWPRPPGLVQVVEHMGSDRLSVLLGCVEPADVAGWAAAELGQEAPTALVDVVVEQTGGLPTLVHPLLQSLVAVLRRTPPGELSTRLGPGRPARFELPAELLDHVRAALPGVDDDARTVLLAASLGAPLDTALLATALEVSTREAAEALHRARAGGFLLTDGSVPRVVASVLATSTPREVVRSLGRRLMALLPEQGDEPLDLARALAADGISDPNAAALLLRHGTGALSTDPGLAGTLLGEAVSAGLPAAAVNGRRAAAAALVGDLDGALRWADAALRDEPSPERCRAADVAAAVLARRGLLARSAELYRVAGPRRAAARALVLLGLGARPEAEEAVRHGASAGSDATLLSGAEQLMVDGVLASVRPGCAAPEAMAAALSSLTRAAALLEPVGGCVLLPDTPSALAGLVALHNGELGIAESGLRRALAAGIGGRGARARHLLLLAWAAMLRGRIEVARQHMTRATREVDGPLEPRDELFLRTLEVGLARRSSDSLALVAAWERAREAVLRHPVDLFTLLPLGELVVAAARLRETDVLAPHRSAAGELLARLGNPPLWATSLQWAGVQAAILGGDPAALGPHATALVSAARTHPFAAVLARAGRSWLRVLTDDVDAQEVIVAAEGLGAAGLAWDGSRLAGQAAARARDARDRTTLLHCARALAEDDGEPPARDGAATPSRPADTEAGGALSAREREVAELLCAGQTYREIGSRLFISAKTVEHHVARMRQRLGATTRSDLLARLRTELARGADPRNGGAPAAGAFPLARRQGVSG